MSSAGRDDDHDVLDVSAVRRLRVPELRARLEARGLDSTGLKAVLVDRLWGAMQADRREVGEAAECGRGADPSGVVAGGGKSAADERMARSAQELLEAANSFLSGENGVEKDLAKGAELLKEAGHAGLAEAQNMLGDFYCNAKMGFPEDFEEAAKWCRRAADQGDAEGQWALGSCYQFGDGVGKDDVEAARLYRLSADQGYANGQCQLGYCYDHGKGVDQDEKEAVKLYRLAADQGYAVAQNNLGVCYLEGDGVERNGEEAARLFRLSAEQGNAKGQCELGYCYHYGVGVDQDKEEAVKWYRLAVEQGLAIAQFNLGVCYHDGVGVERDYEEAARLFQLAADQDFGLAQYNLGVCYEDGKGVEQDYAEAARLFQLLADQDDEDAQERLGLLYFEGNGVQRNCDTSLSLLRRSGSNDEYVTDAIAKIEKGARELLEKRSDVQRIMIEAGESVFGQVQDGTGDFLLHFAARAMRVDALALLFDHPSFDDLVLRANTAGELPRDVVSTRTPLKAQSRDARAMRSILSVSRRTRAACVLWCFEVLRDAAPERLMACIPLDIVREIVKRLLPSAPPGSLYCEVSTLMFSPSAWTRPCLAIAPPILPQPTSPQDVIALQQQQQQHEDLAHSVQGTGTNPERGTKRVLEEQADDVTSDGEDYGALRSEMDLVEPASKRLRS